jgi:hypothetical protein
LAPRRSFAIAMSVIVKVHMLHSSRTDKLKSKSSSGC